MTLSPIDSEKFQTYFNAIKSYRSRLDRKEKDVVITLEIVDKRLFPAYKKLLSKVNTDIEITTGIRTDRNITSSTFTYGEYTLSQIILSLEQNFDLESINGKYRLTQSSVKAFLSKSTEVFPETARNSAGIIYLATSTYQQKKELEIKPKGIFALDLGSKKAVLYYFKDTESNNFEKFEGRVEYNNHLLYISLPAKNPRKLYILKAKETGNWSTIKYLRGTYTSDSNTFPEAGMVFCEQAISFEDAKKKFKEGVPMEIQYELLHAQFKTDKPLVTDDADLADHPFRKSAELIKNTYKGTYRGFYLSAQNQVEQNAILISTLIITESGVVHFYCNEDDPEGKYKGYVLIKDDGLLHFRITQSQHLNMYKYFITLKQFKSILAGAFGGDLQRAPIPGYGRVVFTKISDDPFLGSPIVGTVFVKNSEAMKSFFKEHLPGIKDLVIDYLSGIVNHNINLADSPVLIFKDSEYDISKRYGTSNTDIIRNSNIVNLGWTNTEDIEVYKGVYKGFIVDYFDDQRHNRLQEIIFEIFSTGIVRAKSKHHENYSGNFGLSADGKKIVLSIVENGVEIIRHYLDKIKGFDKSIQNIELRGTYCGMGERRTPIGGRILMKKLDINTNYEDIMPADYDLSEDKNHRLDIFQSLIPFFMGVEDNMVESYKTMYDSSLLPRFFSTNKEMESISGIFKVFRLRNRRKSISIVPMIINKDGSVKMKSSKDSSGTATYIGKAVLTNNEILSILFYKRGTDESYSYLIFNKTNEPITGSNVKFIGFFTSWMPHDNRVFSTRVVVEFQSKDTMKFENEDVQVVDVPTMSKPPTNDYEKYNKNKVMDYLASEENNMLRAGRGARIKSLEKDGSYTKKFDYGKIFFIAAIQAYLNDETVHAETLWKHCKEQGFRDEDFFSFMITNYNLKNTFFDKDI
jgi:hypothetical protein